MWTQDILMALYFLKRDLLVDRIEGNYIYFTTHVRYPLGPLVDNYNLILKGQIPTAFPELYNL